MLRHLSIVSTACFCFVLTSGCGDAKYSSSPQSKSELLTEPPEGFSDDSEAAQTFLFWHELCRTMDQTRTTTFSGFGGGISKDLQVAEYKRTAERIRNIDVAFGVAPEASEIATVSAEYYDAMIDFIGVDSKLHFRGNS